LGVVCGSRAGGRDGLRSLAGGGGGEDGGAELLRALDAVRDELERSEKKKKEKEKETKKGGGEVGADVAKAAANDAREDELAALSAALEALRRGTLGAGDARASGGAGSGPSVPVTAAERGRENGSARSSVVSTYLEEAATAGAAMRGARARETRVGKRRDGASKERMGEAQRARRAREAAKAKAEGGDAAVAPAAAVAAGARAAKDAQPVGASARRKMRAAKLAYHREHGYPEETRQAIVAYHTGREKSAEARAKTSATMKAYWDRRRVAEGKPPLHDAALRPDADEARQVAAMLDLVPDVPREVSLVDAEAMASRAARLVGMVLNHGGLSCDLDCEPQVLHAVMARCASARDPVAGDVGSAMARCADEAEALGEQLHEMTRELRLWADAFEVLEGGLRPSLADLWETEKRGQGLVDRFAALAELSDRMACIKVAAAVAAVADELAVQAAARGRAETTLQAARLRAAEARVVRDEELMAYVTDRAARHAAEGRWTDPEEAWGEDVVDGVDEDEDDVWGDAYGAMLRDFSRAKAAGGAVNKGRRGDAKKGKAAAKESAGQLQREGSTLLDCVKAREGECAEELAWLWEAQVNLLAEWKVSGGASVPRRPPMPVASGESVSLSCDRVAGGRVRVVRAERQPNDPKAPRRTPGAVHAPVEVVADLGVGRRGAGNGDWDLLWVLLPHEAVAAAHRRQDYAPEAWTVAGNAGGSAAALAPGHYFYAIPSHELSLHGFLRNAKRGSGKMRVKLHPARFDPSLPAKARNAVANNLWANQYLFRYEDLVQPDHLRRVDLMRLLAGERLSLVDRRQ